MKKAILFVSFILLYIIPASTLAGDDPCNATSISNDNSDFLEFDNSINTDSGVDAPPIGGYIGSDFWFSFIMPTHEIQLFIEGLGMIDPAIAIYSGDCTDPLLIYNVTDNNCNNGVSPALTLDELSSGEQYYIRVWAQDGSVNGTFNIFLGTELPELLGFIAFGDASIDEDCVQLTTTEISQQGCAWYQEEIDFSMPFSHEMLANFGNLDGNGADGICLVYQSNGPDYCGILGGGIGALGMPNSAIFEFDTYQNGIYSDPIQDHTSFNVNGNMSHPASIAGPVQLGNIEDGIDHNILFNWDPNGNLYELYFDNVLIFSGSYDIINNCFNGNPLAYWGYTASTGALYNNQSICPIVVNYFPATVSYEEITICEGESYNGWTESGFYISQQPTEDGCEHQTHTRLFVIPYSDPNTIEQYICEGDEYTVANISYSNEGVYFINTISSLGCDSTIILDLKVIIPSINILGEDTLSCLIDSIDLHLDANVNYPIDNVNYTWSTPYGNVYSDTVFATMSGDYSVSASFYYLDNECIVDDALFIESDTVAPSINMKDYSLPCDTLSVSIDSISTQSNGIDYVWNGTENLANVPNPTISQSGVYYVTAIDTSNHCMTLDSMYIDIQGPSPNIDIIGDNILNCSMSSLDLTVEIDQTNTSIQWYDENENLISESNTITVTDEGLYTVQVASVTGCTSTDSIIIFKNLDYPIIEINSDTIDCDHLVSTVEATIQMGELDYWETPDGSMPTELNFETSVSGIYTIHAVNLASGCTLSETIEIIDNKQSPDFNLTTDTITCDNPSIDILLQLNSSYQSVTWTFPDGTITNSLTPITSESGAHQLHIEVDGDCDFDTTFIVAIDTISPSFTVDHGTIYCNPDSTYLTIENPIGLNNVTVTFPNNTISNSYENIVYQEGIYHIATQADNGCITETEIEVTSITTPPEVDIEHDDYISCNTSTATINTTSTLSDLSYIWSDDQANMIGTTNSITVENSGIYTLEITDQYGCKNQYNITIDERLDPPIIDLIGDDITCVTLDVDISYESNETLISKQWSDKDSSLGTGEMITVSQVGWYYFTGQNEYGCESTDSIEIIENISAPELDLISNDTIFLKPGDIGSIIINEISTGNTSYIWSPTEGLSCSDCLEPKIIDFVHDSYLLEVTNEFGCVATLRVFVGKKKITVVNIPNIFSPSVNDGNNDHFTLYGNENVALINEVYIYDRWGSMVYSNFDFLPNIPYLGWDGYYKGQLVVNGVYVYLFRITTTDGEVLTFTGDVTKL